MTKVSNVYLGLSRAPVSLRRKPLGAGTLSCRTPTGDGETPLRSVGRGSGSWSTSVEDLSVPTGAGSAYDGPRVGGAAGSGVTPSAVAGADGVEDVALTRGTAVPGGLLVELDGRGRGVEAVVDGHHDLHRPAVAAGQRALDLEAEADLEQVAGEVARHRDDHHVVVHVQRLGVVQPPPQLGRRLEHHLLERLRRWRCAAVDDVAHPVPVPLDRLHPRTCDTRSGGRRHPTDRASSLCRPRPAPQCCPHPVHARRAACPGEPGNRGGDVPSRPPPRPRHDVERSEGEARR